MQRGFTLTELMVSIVLGLLLTIAVASLFVHSRSTYTSTDETSRLQENMRSAQDLLTRMIRHASYVSVPNVYKDPADTPGSIGALTVFDPALSNAAIEAVGGAGATNDLFILRYQGTGPQGAPDGAMTDCHGRVLDGTQISENQFYIKPIGDNGGPALWCISNIKNTLAGPAPPPLLDKEVVPDVENMKLVFGEDIIDQAGNTTRDGSAEKYTDVGGVVNMNKVVAVRIALLFRTGTANVASVLTEPRTYNLNNVTFGPFSDKRIRRVLTMTITMRNRSS